MVGCRFVEIGEVNEPQRDGLGFLLVDTTGDGVDQIVQRLVALNAGVEGVVVFVHDEDTHAGVDQAQGVDELLAFTRLFADGVGADDDDGL